MYRRGFVPITVALILAGVVVFGVAVWLFVGNARRAPEESRLHIQTTSTSLAGLGSPAAMTSTQPQAEQAGFSSAFVSSVTSSDAIIAAACSAPFDATTTIGTSLIEIKNDSLLINGVEKISSIPELLGAC
jgi:hypothetical protein